MQRLEVPNQGRRERKESPHEPARDTRFQSQHGRKEPLRPGPFAQEIKGRHSSQAITAHSIPRRPTIKRQGHPGSQAEAAAADQRQHDGQPEAQHAGGIVQEQGHDDKVIELAVGRVGGQPDAQGQENKEKVML